MRISTDLYEKNKKALMKQLDIDSYEYEKLIHDAWSRGINDILAKATSKVTAGLCNSVEIKSELFDSWNFLWDFERSIHFVLKNPAEFVMPVKGIDTTYLDECGRDIEIDTVVNGEPVYLRLLEKMVTMNIATNKCDYTLEVYYKGECIRCHFESSAFVTRIYVEYTTACFSCHSKCLTKYESDKLFRVRSVGKKDFDNSTINVVYMLQIAIDVASIYAYKKSVLTGTASYRNSHKNLKVLTRDCSKLTAIPFIDYFGES